MGILGMVSIQSKAMTTWPFPPALLLELGLWSPDLSGQDTCGGGHLKVKVTSSPIAFIPAVKRQSRKGWRILLADCCSWFLVRSTEISVEPLGIIIQMQTPKFYLLLNQSLCKWGFRVYLLASTRHFKNLNVWLIEVSLCQIRNAESMLSWLGMAGKAQKYWIDMNNTWRVMLLRCTFV